MKRIFLSKSDLLVALACATCCLRINAQVTLKLGPESFSTPVEGMPVTFAGSGTVKLFTPPGAQRMDVAIDSVIDLSDLQRVIPAIVQAKGNKNDDCSEIVRLHTVALRATGDVYVGGHYERWTCAIGKNKVFEQNGDVTIGLTLAVRKAGKELGVDAVVKDVHADGAIGGILRGPVMGPYLTDWLKAKLVQVINPSNLRGSFPAGLSAYNPTFTSAKFVDLGSGKLGATLAATFSLNQDQAQQLIANLRK